MIRSMKMRLWRTGNDFSLQWTWEDFTRTQNRFGQLSLSENSLPKFVKTIVFMSTLKLTRFFCWSSRIIDSLNWTQFWELSSDWFSFSTNRTDPNRIYFCNKEFVLMWICLSIRCVDCWIDSSTRLTVSHFTLFLFDCFSKSKHHDSKHRFQG